MDGLKQLRAETSRIGKEYASRCSSAESAVEAKQLLEEGTKKLEELYTISVRVTVMTIVTVTIQL